ncbi:restriction endonuclease subunit S [Polynucleobacter asymbioticus]|jgi:type I restriction enzyme S subunit|uniref:restriction endonuclease subunit S n=1 Tax=Polynucleobacter asymbioticus TaxID=576611 RepID=UPI0008F9716F|nr:restriction endonuclease subunit S [Polynucleobacter asymbioticus]APC05675.1 hypothetical protein AOC10_03540 [Polynucleobacter asymbioticus]
MKNWITDEINNLCNVEYGTRVVKKEDGGTIYPVYGGGGATFFMDTFNRENRLTIARFAMSSQCTRFIEGKFFLNDSGLTLSPKDSTKLNQEFLDYQCLAMNDIFYSLAKGSAQKNLDVPAFRRLKIKIPTDIEVQKQIVSKLDIIFAELEKAITSATSNTNNAETLFQNYLTEVFESGSQDWNTDKLEKFVDIKHGFAFDGEDFEQSDNEKLPIVLTPGNFTEDGKLYFSEKNTKRLKNIEKTSNQFSIGDLVVVMTDLSSKMKILGKPAIIDRDSILHNQRIGLFQFKSNDINKEFLYYFLKTRKYIEAIKATSTGSMVRHTAPKRILATTIKYPTLKKQIDLVSKFEEFSKTTHELSLLQNKRKNELALLKQSILNQSFSDKLTR